MSNANRPWWADPDVVRENLERREHQVVMDYLRGLADLVEAAIAYGPNKSKAARTALDALDAAGYAHTSQRVKSGRVRDMSLGLARLFRPQTEAEWLGNTEVQ